MIIRFENKKQTDIQLYNLTYNITHFLELKEYPIIKNYDNCIEFDDHKFLKIISESPIEKGKFELNDSNGTYLKLTTYHNITDHLAFILISLVAGFIISYLFFYLTLLVSLISFFETMTVRSISRTWLDKISAANV